MTWGYVAIGAGTAVAGYMGKEASKAGVGAADAATAEERRQFDLQWDANALRRESADEALGRMNRMLRGGEINPDTGQPYADELMEADPGYQWRVQQGTEGVQNVLSAQNRRLGGSGLKALEDYRQGAASQEFQNIFSRQGTVAGYGPAASQTPANAISQGIMASGQAEAGRYSAYNQAIQGGLQNYLSYQTQQNVLNQPNYAGDWQSPDPSVWG